MSGHSVGILCRGPAHSESASESVNALEVFREVGSASSCQNSKKKKVRRRHSGIGVELRMFSKKGGKLDEFTAQKCITIKYNRMEIASTS